MVDAQRRLRRRIDAHKEREFKHEGAVVSKMLTVTASLPEDLREKLAFNTSITVSAGMGMGALVALPYASRALATPHSNSSNGTANSRCAASFAA